MAATVAFQSGTCAQLRSVGGRSDCRSVCLPGSFARSPSLSSFRLRVNERKLNRNCFTKAIATPVRPSIEESPDVGLAEEEFDPSVRPPFTLSDIRAAIPKHCWEKNSWKSVSYVLRDVAIVFGLAAAAVYAHNPLVWPLYWLAQGTMFWGLFVVGHDCGHGSFSNNKALNDFIGHLTHASILVPYHGWITMIGVDVVSRVPLPPIGCQYLKRDTMMSFCRRISHRTHHANHGHAENDESWHPMNKTTYDGLEFWAKIGRLSTPWALFAYPFYLWSRSPGKKGSHFDPKSDLFLDKEKNDVLTSTACYFAMLALVVGLSFKLGPLMMLNLYIIPYWLNVVWLDAVTYLHHHGYDKKVPWFRGEEWNYMRGGLSTIDRDYGAFNNIHHDIGTHVVHHLFPQIPHYNLIEATEAVKPVMGKYYREPEKSKGWFPFHLVRPLIKSFQEDHFVADEGDVLFYQQDPKLAGKV